TVTVLITTAPRPWTAAAPRRAAAGRRAGERPNRAPVWFMRQAGRSLPEYRRLRAPTSDMGCWTGSPIAVDGRVWGAMGVGLRRERLPQDTEQRLAGFTELVATAIANAESRSELTTS